MFPPLQSGRRRKLPNPRLFTRENLNEQSQDQSPGFLPFRKKTVTWMMRVTTPFKVVTHEGVVECDDGYVAVDEEGWPYPIALSVHGKSYEPAEDV
jgi:hypothetical protein